MRIFELRKLATQEMQHTKKMSMYNKYRGGQAEKTVAKKLAGEYNTKARIRADEEKFSGVNDWESYLYGTFGHRKKVFVLCNISFCLMCHFIKV